MEILKPIELLLDYLESKMCSPDTKKNYKGAVFKFMKHFEGLKYTELKAISGKDVQKYLNAIPGRSSRCTAHHAINALCIAMGYPNKVNWIPYPPKEFKQPIRVTHEEFLKIIAVCENAKHSLLFCVMFDAGLRISEVIRLKLTDIDREQMLFHVLGGKHKKDRGVKLSSLLLSLIEAYIEKYQPQEYLFEGESKHTRMYAKKSIQEVVKKYCKLAGVNAKISPHKFRHGFAMSLLENGEDYVRIANQLGHNSTKTVEEVYAPMNNKVIQKIKSPMEQIAAAQEIIIPIASPETVKQIPA